MKSHIHIEGMAPKTSARISEAFSSSKRLEFMAGICTLGLCPCRQGYLMRRPTR